MPAAYRTLFYLLFALSGFSALVYESIWSHYVKLFLGHAAYAQTLVIAIFMGGMAIGSWFASALSTRRGNLLRLYALAEGGIGVCALLFHQIFDHVTRFSHGVIMAHISSPSAAYAFKWLLSALLILPQSILIGLPFPLMSAAIIRLFPQRPGKVLSLLYFANSLGAAIGVLASGFLLVAALGLPGTICTAGIINIVLAIIVWRLASGAYGNAVGMPEMAPGAPTSRGGWYRPLLVASLITGSASFIYEIGWIRMLSLVLGSSTHAFELMLSAFILGLAGGALWIQHLIDRIAAPVRFLVVMQIVMGVFALVTLPVYGNTFTVMHWLLQNLDRTDAGYHLFNLGSHTMALAVMLPATFCAGSTLPLITFTLMKEGHGEKSIGVVYAANTVGAIIGVCFAIHLGMPLLGLKGLIICGGGVDIALGVALLWLSRERRSARLVPALVTVACAGAVVITALVVHLDPYRMASGVYRRTGILEPDLYNILYHRDGKTATVSLALGRSGTLSIRTNGKPDASINMNPSRDATPDEATMVLSAVIPMALNPRAQTVANIGFGSGLTAHTLLGNPRLSRVDTVEIEPGMVEAARNFGPHVDRVYSDKRSVIHIDDAKTFFSTHRANKYDIIVSEPSNPWVSGVGGLFSEEFYRTVTANLAPNGLFVQWLQLYELDAELVASVLKALSATFTDYVAYAPNDADLLLVARNGGPVGDLVTSICGLPEISRALHWVRIDNVQDLEIRRIGTRETLARLVAGYAVRPNSDYYPVLDLRAARSRFLNTSAVELQLLSHDPLPATEMLTGWAPTGDT
ncbi:MAG TPA: fused MFS/spermidine synthase, partial [Geobacteraceae bacterium]